MPTFDEAWAISRSIEGWLLEEQGRAIFEAAKELPPGTAAVEIGSHRGKSTTLIALGLPPGAKVTAVDPFDDPRWGGGVESLAAFERNLESAGVTDRVDLFRGLSIDASSSWKGPPVGFLWVDGAHDRKSTLQDFDGWMPHLARGALIYVHDAFSAVGTTQAVLLRFWFSSRIEYLGCHRTLVQFRVNPMSARQRAISGLRMSRRLPFFARMVAIKISRRKRWHALESRLMIGGDEPLI